MGEHETLLNETIYQGHEKLETSRKLEFCRKQSFFHRFKHKILTIELCFQINHFEWREQTGGLCGGSDPLRDKQLIREGAKNPQMKLSHEIKY